MRLILLDEIASAVNAILPASFTDAMRKSVQDAVLSTIRKMNLVSRDEVEELEKTLLQLREKIEALEESAAKPQQPVPIAEGSTGIRPVETFENEGGFGFIPPNPETNNKYEREVEERLGGDLSRWEKPTPAEKEEERPRWKNAFGEVITPAEKAALQRDQDKKEVKEQLEKAGVIGKTDPRDVFWESVKDTGVSEQTVAVLFDQLVQKRKYGMTDDEIGTEIKQALLGWIRSKKAPKATPNLKSQQGPQIIIRPSNVTEISTNLMKLFIKGQVETARQSTGPSKPSARKKA